MTIASIPSPPNLFLLPALPAVSSASGVAVTLRPEQLVRALVVAATAREELLLEIGKERFRPVGSRPLQPGQVLDLRIIQTTPRLEALVVNNRLQEQLAVRLPSLSQPFDWSGLLERLQRPELARQLPQAQQTLVNQLRQLLDPEPGSNTVLREQVHQLALQLRLLGLVGQGGARTAALPLPPVQQEVYQALQPLLQELKGLLGMGSAAPRSAAALTVPLAPDLLGRIEGLGTQIHQLLTREGLAPLLQQGLQLVAVQLQQLTLAPPTLARGEVLGFLSQFFGLHLERELLLGKQKQALANLKQILLTLQQKSGEDLREPLSRIELFQLCRARFSEAQLQFLPLPMVGLSDGYLLASRQQAEEQGDPGRKPQEEVQISLSLRLSSLGSMRVDLNLLPDKGLVVRLACESRHKMEYLKGCEEELTSVLTQMKLRQIHYSADAQHPLKQLQQSLLPRQNTLLDTRA